MEPRGQRRPDHLLRFRHPERSADSQAARHEQLSRDQRGAESAAHGPGDPAPAIPQPLFQETGTRFSRALPYELHTSARLGTDGAVELLFSNTGDAGAVFHVYDKRNLDLIPRRYTVEAGKTLSDTWTGGDYDLWVYSTNGFVRTFAGNTQRGAALEVQVCYEPRAARST